MSGKQWHPGPKPGYVVCPRCFALVEDKGLKRAFHLASEECQRYGQTSVSPSPLTPGD